MQAGDTVSHWKIEAKLGEGAMGVVYRAQDLRLGRAVALKLLAPGLAGNDLARRRFSAEARAASALDHPNICALYDIGETAEGQLYLALALCEGETLRDRLRRGRLEPRPALEIAIQLASGLAEAHDKGIVHRDIKPANLMLRPDGLVKILDFGLARLEREAGLTATGTVGSPAYMAPEQIAGGEVGPAADIWAAGVVLYEMLAGHRPFAGEGIPSVLHAILHSPAPDLGSLRPDLPPPLLAVVERALAKERAERQRSARELQAELSAAAAALATGSTGATLTIATATRLAPHAGSRAASDSQPSAATPPSLAVLPFADLSPARDQDWFCEGLAEELITALSGVEGLRVASRASTLQFRDQDPRTIGRKLQVETLLTGGVRKAGNRLRITTQLVKVTDGSVLASSRWDGDLDDVFALQDEIARAAVESVQARLGSGAAPLVRRPTEDVEAYNSYLKGRFHWNRRTVAALDAAIPWLEQAIARDPGFALAYVGLADVQLQLGILAAASAREVAERGLELCSRALAIDPELADARTTLATLRAIFDLDRDGAEAELRRVLAQSPDHAQAYQALAMYVLSPMGRHDEAVAAMHSALAIDPVALAYNTSLGFALHFARRSEEAVTQLRATLEIDPGFAVARRALVEVLIDLGRLAEAEDLLRGIEPAAEPSIVSAIGFCHARAGRTAEARAVLAQVEQGRAQGRSAASHLLPATVLMMLGELEPALDQLEQAFEEREPLLIWVGVRPLWDPLRQSPRFQRILEGMGLPNLGPDGPIA